MSIAYESNNTTLLDLIQHKLIHPPCHIRADISQQLTEATINEHGHVVINSQQFSDLETAMASLTINPNSTSSAWQFWSCYSEERQAWAPLEHFRAKLSALQHQDEVRTSVTHPLRIDSVSYPASTGRIGLTFCPGKCDQGLYGGNWQRDLSSDLEAIVNWGASTLISLIESHEFPLLKVPNFSEAISAAPLKWLHLPIQDMQIPAEKFELLWQQHSKDLHHALAFGEAIVIHCRGGLGRTGLLAARILVEAGISPVDAVGAIREARQNSIETYAQEQYVLTKAWIK